MKTIFVAMAAAIGGALFFGCSSSDGGADSCGHFYDVSAARAERCGFQPAGEKARWVQVCSASMTLSGSGLSATWLDACASATEAADCDTKDISECEEPAGTLAENDSCVLGSQCESGDCNSVKFEDDGTLTCGTCEKKKDSADASSSVKEIGDTCIELSGTTSRTFECAEGAYCDIETQKCVAQLKDGKYCASSAACKSGRCAEGKCTARAEAGEACDLSSECASGLGCEDGECAKYTYGDPGDDCDYDTKRCKKGYCSIGLSSSSGKGSCPAILEDGKACDDKDSSSQCETYSRCINGECKFVYGGSLECQEPGSSKKSSSSTDDTGTSN